MKGQEVLIHPRGNTALEAEGIATLIEKISETKNSERWLVQFKGETRLHPRTIRKDEPEEERPPLKFIPRTKGNTVRYYGNKQSEESRKANRELANRILGRDRDPHSELKYEYKKQRRKNER